MKKALSFNVILLQPFWENHVFFANSQRYYRLYNARTSGQFIFVAIFDYSILIAHQKTFRKSTQTSLLDAIKDCQTKNCFKPRSMMQIIGALATIFKNSSKMIDIPCCYMVIYFNKL